MKKLLLAPACAVLLTACAGNPSNSQGVRPGMDRDAVIARLGPPTRALRLAAGERLQYSLQPFGQFAWMVDFDTAGRVVRSRQVLNAADFNRIEAGTWTRSDVEREFGPPAMVDAVASWDGPILTYRWSDGSDMFYFVYLDRANVVRRAHAGMEFHNAPDRD
ncbi:MAG: lipoprotein [Ramlibacter sp.]